jgi:hypothetical protein
MKQGSKNIIMGAAFGYAWNDVEVFMTSLSDSQFHGTLILVGIDPMVFNGMRFPFEVRFTGYRQLRLAAKLVRLRNRGRVRYLHRAIASIGRKLPDYLSSSYRVALIPLLHVACSRYIFYERVLLKLKDAEQVILTDVRDVVFNANPFLSKRPDTLNVFLEEQPWTLGTEPVNRQWFRTTYGDAILDEFKDMPISCSGVTIGNRKEMLCYLETMNREITRLCEHIIGMHGVDQSIHNKLLHSGKFPAKPIANGDGIVWTAKLAAMNIMNQPNENGAEKLRSMARRFPIVHQYDWIDILTKETVAGRAND